MDKFKIDEIYLLNNDILEKKINKKTVLKLKRLVKVVLVADQRNFKLLFILIKNFIRIEK